MMTASDQPEPAPTDQADQNDMALDTLARAVLDRSVRPRAVSVRRLAEGVLALQADLDKTGKRARKKAGKKGGKKKKSRKLATIPGQKKDR